MSIRFKCTYWHNWIVCTLHAGFYAIIDGKEISEQTSEMMMAW